MMWVFEVYFSVGCLFDFVDNHWFCFLKMISGIENCQFFEVFSCLRGPGGGGIRIEEPLVSFSWKTSKKCWVS
jgi:hypothetical protein